VGNIFGARARIGRLACRGEGESLRGVRAALESVGALFIAENGGGAGVRLRKGGAPGRLVAR
jgi:hypothetical protein